MVLSYLNARRVQTRAERSKGRLRVVDAKSAYFRLRPGEEGAQALYEALKHLLRA